MHPTTPFHHTNGYRAQRFQCPLLFPQKTGATCDHDQFKKGKGCVKDVNWELGGIQRVTLGEVGSQRGTVVSLDLPQVAVMVFWRYHRTALFQLPLPKPDRRVSPHPAFQGGGSTCIGL